MSTELIDLVQNLGQPRVLVVGDVMLDRYVWGDAERISQEAPVILLARRQARGTARRRQQRGHHAARSGARSRSPASSAPMQTARRIRANACRSRRRRRSGHHRFGPAQHRQGTLHRPGSASPSAADDSRRLRGSPRHRRADPRRRCCNVIQPQLRKADIVLISDYDKGVCTPGTAGAVIDAATGQGRAASRRSDSRRTIIASITAARRSRPIGSKRAWRPGARSNDMTEVCAAATASAREARPRSGHHHARQGRHGPASIATAGSSTSRRGRARSTTSPAPATWS